MLKHNLLKAAPLAALLILVTAGAAFAQDGDQAVAELAYAIDNIFLLIAAVLVLFMQAGFAMLSAGFNSSKNTVNILFKNVIDLSIGGLLYFIIGYGLMYPGEAFAGGFFGWGGVGISEGDPAGPGVLSPQVDWLFQAAFAAAAATIVAGAVSGRMQFKAYLIYSAVLTGLVYPISGFWQWGGGWLAALGLYDFAGSLVVHTVGGFAGLAGAIIIGPRIGKFNKDGSSNPIPGHNMTVATLGVFILLVGWFGFNPGSQLAFVGELNTNITMLVATNTLLAACTGAVLGMITSVFITGKPDITYTLNGMLAGLVGITANANVVTNISAIMIGAVAGVLVAMGMILLEKLRIDDPVGAWPVHGLCGIWGGIATAIFANPELNPDISMMPQIIGSIAIPLWAFVTMSGLFFILKATKSLRVSMEEEVEGLDLTEHGAVTYPEFGSSVVNTKATTDSNILPAS